MDFQVVMAQYVLGYYNSYDLIEIGTQGLVEGYDSLHLSWLAGENPDRCNGVEMAAYFERAMQELGLTLPTWQESVRIIIRYWAGRIVAGEVTPEEGAKKIYSETYFHARTFLVGSDDFWGDSIGLHRWMLLAFDYDNVYDGFLLHGNEYIPEAEAQQVLDADVLDAAREVLAQG